MNRHHRIPALDEKAFTLLEILFVLLIVGFLAAASLKRFGELTDKNVKMAVFAGIAELNTREKMVWVQDILSEKGWDDDSSLFSKLDTNLGKDYVWVRSGPSVDGGVLRFQKRYVFNMGRETSTREYPGRWKVHVQ